MARIVGMIFVAPLFVFLLSLILFKIDSTSFRELIIDVLGKSGHLINSNSSHVLGWEKPPGMEVIGLVFYGRMRFVSVLEPYLRVS